MIDIAKFEPKTVYVTYIAATPERVWEALTSSEFSRKYFWDRSIELEPKLGGAFALRLPDGTANVQGKVIAWDPPRKFAVTWGVKWPAEFAKLPECHVTYEIAPAGDAVRLTMTEIPFLERARGDPIRRPHGLACGALGAEEPA
jgi:uncharacterized protein YndB with AHSA1/START domain